jgi:hypothetical protein
MRSQISCFKPVESQIVSSKISPRCRSHGPLTASTGLIYRAPTYRNKFWRGEDGAGRARALEKPGFARSAGVEDERSHERIRELRDLLMVSDRAMLGTR